jgi:hypothetical protein
MAILKSSTFSKIGYDSVEISGKNGKLRVSLSIQKGGMGV